MASIPQLALLDGAVGPRTGVLQLEDLPAHPDRPLQLEV